MSSVPASLVDIYTRAFASTPALAARAPGRLEFIGNHTDYNGGRVVGVAVEQGITVVIGFNDLGRMRLRSEQSAETVETGLGGWKPLTGQASWANYILGVAAELRKAGVVFDRGVDLWVESDLPAGAGMSSSAALELASARALAAAFGFEADRKTFARIGRAAENGFVGVPCGILDQGVSAFGEAGKLVRIDCREEVFSTITADGPMPFWVFNTAKKHALIDSFYADRHGECMQAFAVLKETRPDAACLSDLTPGEVRGSESALGPVLFKRALHVVEENARVDAVCEALPRGDFETVGEALFASHESSRTLFENSIPELDFLVAELKKTRGVYGARLTGGGFGGAVMAFTHPDFSDADAAEVAAAYTRAFGTAPAVLHTAPAAGARIL